AVFPFAILESQLHSTRLIIRETRAAGNFQVFPMSGSPNLDVIGFRCRKSDVSSAQLDDPIVQPKLLENRFGVAGQLLEHLESLIGMHDLDQLDLVELMHANDAFVVAA